MESYYKRRKRKQDKKWFIEKNQLLIINQKSIKEVKELYKKRVKLY